MGRSPNHNNAFTLIETLIVVVILAITATIVLGFIADTDASLRADRAARECLTAFRYARALALTNGNTCGVRFDTTLKKFWVWQNATPATAVNNSLMPGGTYTVDLVNNREIAGVVATLAIPSDTTNPYDVQFTSLGATSNTGTVTFTYGGRTCIVTIPAVGDPTLN
jgi:prepilin-type N-terminal cleavage/methylation domain-containing protein